MFSAAGGRRERGNVRRSLFSIAIIAAALAGGQLPPAAAQDRLPVKLEIVSSAQAVEVGEGVTLQIVLRGADNAVAAAPKQFSIGFEVTTPAGPLALPNVVIAAGQSAAQVQFQVTAPGMWAVRARNNELLEGGTVIYAKPAGLHSEVRGSDGAPQHADAATESSATVALNDTAAAQTRGIDDLMRTQTEGAGGTGTEVAVASPTATADAATVLLATSPDRRLLADSQDAATVYAFLLAQRRCP